MKIKLATHKEINKLLKLKINRGFKENFSLFIPRLMSKEITFIAIDNEEILGAIAYSSDFPMGKFKIGENEYLFEKDMNFLQFVEVKATARKKGVAKALINHVFEICSATNCGIRISNIVLDGPHLIDIYRQCSKEHQVDLFFYHANNLEPQVFNATPIPKEKPSMFKRLFGF